MSLSICGSGKPKSISNDSLFRKSEIENDVELVKYYY